MRTFAIGDIHGGFKGLNQALSQLNLKPIDRLVFLGDYVDGWSQSSKVIKRLIQLDQEYECIFIKGNHDIWCEDWLRTGKANLTWLKHGGQSTIDSYADYTPKQKAKHLKLFEQMDPFFVDRQNRLYVHAGFTALAGPEKESNQRQLWIDRTLWETALALDDRILRDDVRYPKRLKLFSEIFIGHTPTTKYNTTNPMHAANVWNMDTGAAYTGKVSIINVQTKEIWQSDPLPTLYPNETGRN